LREVAPGARGVTHHLRFAFLISDSRSGSTLLARELTARMDDVLVTTELNFDPVFDRGRGASPQQVARRVASQPNFRSDGQVDDGQSWAGDLVPDETGIPRLFSGLVDRWLNAHAGGAHPECVIIKNGSHARYAAEIHRALGSRVQFIFLVRDPRSVVASKLRTRRPYAPWEVMAWGGSLVAALRWRSYAHNMARARAAGAQVLEVRYEDFIERPAAVIERIAHFCGCSLRDAALPATRYEVPAAERTIHTRATSEEINAARLSEWTTTLAPRDTRIVEALCGSEMEQRGYVPATRRRRLTRVLICAAALPQATALVITHLVSGVLGRLRNNGRDSGRPRPEN
jgi:hypothetical protein